MENSKFFINVSALGGGKFRRSARRRGAYFIYYFARQGGWRPPRGGVHTTMSRTNERTNVTAGGCLRNPLSCYTLRPSIAARTKNIVPCLAAPSASGVNILSTLFFHRTSRTLSPWSFRFSRSSFLLSAEKPLRKESRRWFVRSLTSPTWKHRRRRCDGGRRGSGGMKRVRRDRRSGGKRGTEFCKAN